MRASRCNPPGVILALMLCAQTSVLAADDGGELRPMLKQDYVAPLFADGPRLDEPGFEGWLQAQGPVKLPFTIWRKPRRIGAIGVHGSPPARVLRFNDGALGVPLDERLRQACGAADPCRIWLAGRLGESMPLPDPDPSTAFSVHAVHELVQGEGPLRAQFVRGPDCLAIRVMKPLHCARGPQRCERCKEALAQPAVPKLLDLCPWGEAARPTIEIEREGKKSWRTYEVLRSFAGEAEAKAFAERHRLTDVQLR